MLKNNGNVAAITNALDNLTCVLQLSTGTAPANCTSASVGNLVDFRYDFGLGVNNNGNVVQISNNRDTTRTQSFTYDELNRVATAQSQAASGANCWGNSFAYDIWANLLSKTVTKCTAETLTVAVSTSNRITNAGFTYDAAGNMTNSGSGVMTYDAENRMTNAAGVTYTYDGDGKRVKKSSGKLYWTGTGSDALAETDLAGAIQSEFTFFGGKRVARRDGSGNTVFYYYSDHLGSASVVTSATGTIVEESDYYPFGGERVITNSDPNQYKFTSKERDSESGLDFFIARHYSSNLGRFLQPDEFAGGPVDAFSSNDPLPESPLPYADITNPQSLNKYTYTYNNPLVYTDPNGHCPICIGAILGAGAGGAVILYRTFDAYTSGKPLPTNKEIAKTLAIGAVIGGTLGAVHGAAAAAGSQESPPSEQQPASSEDSGSEIRNPYGSKGAPDHQEGVEQGVKDANAEKQPGEKVLREQKVQGHDSSRRPDVQIVDEKGKTRKVIEVERNPGGSYHKERVKEYERCGIECETRPLERKKD